MYMVILLSVAFAAWFVSIWPPLRSSTKTAAYIAQAVLTGVVSFCLSGALTRALLDLFR